MTPAEFEAQLRADGFDDIEQQDLATRPPKGRHRHLFAIRGLVLGGTFIVRQGEDEVTYGPGQVFAVAAGELHDEFIGEGGASVVVGRRHRADDSTSSG